MRDEHSPSGVRQMNDGGSETRTTVSLGHRQQGHCRRCGQPVPGRRRNGYCSDRCRMAVRRAEQSVRIERLIAALEQATASLRWEMSTGKGAYDGQSGSQRAGGLETGSDARGDEMRDSKFPAVSCDEVLALIVLWERYVLSNEHWLAAIASTGSSAAKRFPELRDALLEKRYVIIVSNEDLVELSLPTTVSHYTVTEIGCDLLMKGSLAADVPQTHR